LATTGAASAASAFAAAGASAGILVAGWAANIGLDITEEIIDLIVGAALLGRCVALPAGRTLARGLLRARLLWTGGL